MVSRPVKVLIAQHGTITHYRIPFYTAMEARRPPEWNFRVVYDAYSGRNHEFYKGLLRPDEFQFPVLPVRSRTWNVGGQPLMWQSFFREARHYDVIVTDTYVKHLTYVASFLYKLGGKKRVFWGIPRDVHAVDPGAAKRAGEWLKQRLLFATDHFMAYTPGSRDYLLSIGYPDDRITVLYNTIDTEQERALFRKHAGEREAIRTELGISPDRKVILYVGRLLKLKRIRYMLEMMEALHRKDGRFLLLVVGGGEETEAVQQAAERWPGAIRYLGTVDDQEETARIHVASDAYFIPGYVGLAPLQAFCYDLPVVAAELEWHSPEVEYLTPSNSAFLPAGASPAQAADLFPRFLEQFDQAGFRGGVFRSIGHLSIVQMADRFISGINQLLSR